MNGFYNINKTSHHHINKTTRAIFFLTRLITFSPLFLQVSLQVVTPRCKEGQELDEFTLYIPWTSFTVKF